MTGKSRIRVLIAKLDKIMPCVFWAGFFMMLIAIGWHNGGPAFTLLVLGMFLGFSAAFYDALKRLFQ